VLYHSAAVFASNYIAVICSVAEELFADAGISSEARGAIASLAASAIENWHRGSGDRRYTGPIVRGDVDCVAAHLSALEKEPPLRDLYTRLGLALTTALSENAQRKEIKALLQRVVTP
jgi:predicted short-subunit dehydrogenase-like oxidoreductase (DUF2520 family)